MSIDEKDIVGNEERRHQQHNNEEHFTEPEARMNSQAFLEQAADSEESEEAEESESEAIDKEVAQARSSMA